MNLTQEQGWDLGWAVHQGRAATREAPWALLRGWGWSLGAGPWSGSAWVRG